VAVVVVTARQVIPVPVVPVVLAAVVLVVLEQHRRRLLAVSTQVAAAVALEVHPTWRHKLQLLVAQVLSSFVTQTPLPEP
jgi:hypothetical protein